jgi:DNA-binding NarL/FixJ family response regulator
VRQALEAAGFEVCAEASDAPGAVAAAREQRPDVCLLDINMPGNGITATARIVGELPDTAVVMLTVSRDDEDLFDALRAGASGYLLKDMNPERLPAAVQGVLEGEAALPRTLVARVIGEFRERGKTRRMRLPGLRERGVSLTPREWDVLELLRAELKTAQIGERLGMSPVTVRRHVSEILRKLRVPDRKAALELIQQAERRRS